MSSSRRESPLLLDYRTVYHASERYDVVRLESFGIRRVMCKDFSSPLPDGTHPYKGYYSKNYTYRIKEIAVGMMRKDWRKNYGSI